MSNPVEVIRQFHGTRSFGSRENLIAQTQNVGKVYRSLGSNEISEVVTAAIEDGEQGEDYLTCLACLHPGSLKPFQERFVDHELFGSGLIYHDANEEVASRLIVLLDAVGNGLSRNHLLLCLAWAGNDLVQRQFADWRSSPPTWAKDLYVLPHSYASEAGWELTADGKRRDLFFKAALPLIKPNGPSDHENAVSVGGSTGESCPWCGRNLVALISLNSSVPPLLPLGIKPERTQIVTCDVCTAFGLVFGKLDREGNGSWHAANKRPDCLPDDSEDWGLFPEHPLVLSGQQRHFMESASWTKVPEVSFSQIGGLPTWVQDAEYPDCPECSGKMMFVAQISNEDYDPMMEGIFYTFVCAHCNTTATHYQQS